MTRYMVSMVLEYQHPFRALEAVMERMLSRDNQDGQMSWADDTLQGISMQESACRACLDRKCTHVPARQLACQHLTREREHIAS
jgi:hypothetical protein